MEARATCCAVAWWVGGLLPASLLSVFVGTVGRGGVFTGAAFLLAGADDVLTAVGGLAGAAGVLLATPGLAVAAGLLVTDFAGGVAAFALAWPLVLAVFLAGGLVVGVAAAVDFFMVFTGALAGTLVAGLAATFFARVDFFTVFFAGADFCAGARGLAFLEIGAFFFAFATIATSRACRKRRRQRQVSALTARQG